MDLTHRAEEVDHTEQFENREGGFMRQWLTAFGFLLITSSLVAKERSPIREFLGGYTLKDGKRIEGFVPGGEFSPGMGIENPGLIELFSLAHGALGAIHDRMESGASDWNADLGPLAHDPVQRLKLEGLLKKELQITRAERTNTVKTERLSPGEKSQLEALLKATKEDPKRVRQDFLFLERSKRQYSLAWRLMTELIRRSMNDFDLRGYSDKKALTTGGSDEEKLQKDLALKRYVVDKAGELYVGSLKFLSLRQNPIPGHKRSRLEQNTDTKSLEQGDLDTEKRDVFAWLDWEEFDYLKPGKIDTFIYASPEVIPYYANQNVIPAAKSIAEGFKKILHSSPKNSALMKMNLNEPSHEDRRALAEQVLDTNVLAQIPQKEMAKTQGLVTFYLHCISAMVNSFNVNTHDSFEIMRVAVFVLFRHVIDLELNYPKNLDGLRKAKDTFTPFKELPKYLPLKEIAQLIHARRWQIFYEESKSGPYLDDKNDKDTTTRDYRFRSEEFSTYHGDLIRDVFGTDYSHYVWPLKQKASDSDPRIHNPFPREGWHQDKNGKVVPEVRLPNGEPLPESKKIQSGDIWAELGTGVGSQLISLSTQPAPPGEQVKSFIHHTSIWDVAKEKLYNRWTAAIAWSSEKSKDFFFGYDLVPEALRVKTPGAGIDYTGLSHVGIIETFSDPNYPEFDRADFIDAFPNRMRQAWRAHGWGFSHARRAAVFRLRNEVAEAYVRTFDARYQKLENQLDNQLWLALPESQKLVFEPDRNDKERIYYACKKFLTSIRYQMSDFDNVAFFTQSRINLAPGYAYCNAVFQRRGMDNFQARILDQGGRTMEGDVLVKKMGELAVEVGRGIRNQHKEYEGMGVIFDNHFDSYTKSDLYCSEFSRETWLLGTGLPIWYPTKFRKSIKLALKTIPQATLEQFTAGFWKVPFTENDTVYAPQDIMYDIKDESTGELFGHHMFRPIMVSVFTFFGVNDE